MQLREKYLKVDIRYLANKPISNITENAREETVSCGNHNTVQLSGGRDAALLRLALKEEISCVADYVKNG